MKWFWFINLLMNLIFNLKMIIMLNKMQKIKEKVKNLLTNKPELRDNDNRLIANIYYIIVTYRR